MKLPVGAIVTKTCHCGKVHRDPDHPTYEVTSFDPNRSLPERARRGDVGTWQMRCVQTGRVHSTRSVDGYAILTMPTEAVLVEP